MERKNYPPFPEMVKSFKENVDMNEVLSNFGPNHSFEEMFSYIWNSEDAHCYLTPYLSKGGKSLDKAMNYRLEAQKKFLDKCYDEALELYNLSLMLAPHPKVRRREGLPSFDEPEEPESMELEVYEVHVTESDDYPEQDKGSESILPDNAQKKDNLTAISSQQSERFGESSSTPSTRPKLHVKSRSGHPKDYIDPLQGSPKVPCVLKEKSHSENRASVRDKPKSLDSPKSKDSHDKGKPKKASVISDSHISKYKGGKNVLSGKGTVTEKSTLQSKDTKSKEAVLKGSIPSEYKKSEEDLKKSDDVEGIIQASISDEVQGAAAQVADKTEICESPQETVLPETFNILAEGSTEEAFKSKTHIEECTPDNIGELEKDMKKRLTPEESFENLEEIGASTASDKLHDDLQRAAEMLLDLEVAKQDKSSFEIPCKSKKTRNESSPASELSKIDIRKDLMDTSKPTESCSPDKSGEPSEPSGDNQSQNEPSGSGTPEDRPVSGVREKSGTEEVKSVAIWLSDSDSDEDDREVSQNRNNEENVPAEDGEKTENWKYRFLSQAYESRASYLYRVKEYEKSIIDLDRALRLGCAPSNEHALRVVREHCFEKIDRGGKRNIKGKGLTFSYKTPPPPVLQEKNPQIPAMSSAVKLMYSPREGKHLVATRDIRPGEVLCVEEPFSAAVNVNEMANYCNSCFRRTTILLPCPNCSLVAFCSEKCTMRDSSHPHWAVCTLLSSVIALKHSDYANMALHLLTKITHRQLKERYVTLQEEEVKLPPNTLGMNEQGIYDSGDYRTVFHLQTNKNMKSSLEDFEISSEVFSLMKILLDGRRYFVNENNEAFYPTNQDCTLVGSALFRHFMMLRSSLFNIGELKVVDKNYEDSWVENIGCGIYPAASLINHSCHPNVGLYNHGKTLVLYSISTISKNQPILLSYGTKYRLLPKEMRHDILRENYYFECRCEACQGNWYPDIDEVFQLRCFKCSKGIDMNKGLCSSCNIFYREGKDYKGTPPYNFFHIREQLKSTAENCKRIKVKVLKLGSYPKDRETIINAIELMEKYVKLPCTMLFDAQDTLRTCFEKEGSHIYVKSRICTNQMRKQPLYYINSAWTGRRDITFELSPKKSPKKRVAKECVLIPSLEERFDVRVLEGDEDIEKHHKDEED